MRVLRCCVLLLVAAGSAAAQGVVVSPPTLVMDHRTRSGALELFNPGDRAMEVRIEALFGFPATDSLGQFRLETPPSVPEGMRAATPWLEVYPARVTIPSGGRQTVRFLARPPATLADGEYFTRVAVTSKFAPSAADAAESSTIQTELSLEVRAVSTLLYRKGTPTSALALADPQVSREGDTLAVRVALTPEGTAAFLGTVHYALEDLQGRVVASHALPVAVYVPVNPLVRLAIDALAPGEYRLRIRAVAERADLPSGTILPSPAREILVSVPLVSR